MAAFLVNGMTAAPITPIYACGFEHQGASHAISLGYNGLVALRQFLPGYRQSIRERNGVNSDPGQSGGGDWQTVPFRVAVREAVLGLAIRRLDPAPLLTGVGFQNIGGAVLSRVQCSTSSIWTLHRAGSAELANAGFRDIGDGFTYFFLHSFHDQNVGFMRFYADGFELDRQLAYFDGDTSDSADVYAARVYGDTATTAVNNGHAWDDVVVYARTLFVSAIDGTAPAQGQTVTGDTSGATAVIDQVEPDDADPTKAVLYIAEVVGDFVAGEALTFSGGGTAQAENAHPEDIHGLIRPVFIRHRVPVSDVQSNWTRSAGNADYECIDDRLADDGESLVATEPELVNEHGLEPAPSGLYAGAVFVQPMAIAEQDSGGVGSLHLALRSGSTVSNGDAIPVPGVAGLVQAGATTRDPDTGDEWSVEAADAATLLLESAP